jgi:hypothetical protein
VASGCDQGVDSMSGMAIVSVQPRIGLHVGDGDLERPYLFKIALYGRAEAAAPDNLDRNKRSPRPYGSSTRIIV